MNKIIGLLVLLPSLAVTSSYDPWPVTVSPKQAISRTTTALFAQVKKHPTKSKEAIREIFVPHFDKMVIARWAMGKCWKKLSNSQRRLFIHVFQELLIRTYASGLNELVNDELEIRYGDESIRGDRALVRTTVAISPEYTVSILYRLHNSRGTWKIFDIAIEGVSFISTYRGSICPRMNRIGFNQLIHELENKNQ